MYAERQNITLTTDGAGACTAYSSAVTGRVLAVIVTIGALAATADITITSETTGQPILTLTNVAANAVKYPRSLVQDAVGADTTLREPVAVVNERVKIVVAQGGATVTGTVTLVIG